MKFLFRRDRNNVFSIFIGKIHVGDDHGNGNRYFNGKLVSHSTKYIVYDGYLVDSVNLRIWDYSPATELIDNVYSSYEEMLKDNFDSILKGQCV